MKTFKELMEAKKVTVFDTDGDPIEIVKQTKGMIYVKDGGYGDSAYLVFGLRLNLKNSANEHGKRQPEEKSGGYYIEGIPVKYFDDGAKVSASMKQWTNTYIIKGLTAVQNDKGLWELK